MKNKKTRHPLSVPCTVKPAKNLCFLMPMVGLSVLAAILVVLVAIKIVTKVLLK